MYLSFIRNRGTEVVDRELIDRRRNIWGLEEDMDNLPDGMALEPAKNLQNWACIIQGAHEL